VTWPPPEPSKEDLELSKKTVPNVKGHNFEYTFIPKQHWGPGDKKPSGYIKCTCTRCGTDIWWDTNVTTKGWHIIIKSHYHSPAETNLSRLKRCDLIVMEEALD